VLYTFADSAAFATRLAGHLGAVCDRVAVHRFPDDETLPRVLPLSPRRAVLVRSLHSPNAKIVETLLAADALRRSGARELTLVAPYLPYMRQDAVFHPGEPLSQRVVADVLGRAFDRILTVEAHLHRVATLDDVFPCAARSLSAAPAIAAWIGRADGCVVVGPDRESRPWVEAIADAAGAAAVVGEKRRLSDRRVRVELPPMPPYRRAVLVDDVGSSGSTLASAARAVHRAGIERIDAVVVHAIFAAGALEKIERSGVRRLVSCNSVPHPTNRIDVTPMMAAAMGSKPKGSGIRDVQQR
jgi:ribose-phosphate pyrophosphokinase